jgi:hypothetical protein
MGDRASRNNRSQKIDDGFVGPRRPVAIYQEEQTGIGKSFGRERVDPLVILINGSINAGKTAVSKALCRFLPRTAHVEVDALREFVEWMPLEESIPLNLKNAASVGANFLAYGLNVVVSYPLSSEDYLYLREQFQAFTIYCFTLSPRLEVAQGDRGERVLTDWERERIASQYESGTPSPSFGVLIDNSDLSVEETARKIIQRIEADRESLIG